MVSISRGISHVFRCIPQISRANKHPLRSSISMVNTCNNGPAAMISTSKASAMKNINVKTEGQITEISGEYYEDPGQDKVINMPVPHEKACPLCPHRLNMDIKYTDVLVLSQFLRPDGCLLPRHVTGCCMKAQAKLKKLVHQAQRAGLMPELRPDLPDGRERTSLKSNHKWRKYNIFYKDS